MPWIKQLPDLYKAVKKYQIHRTIVVDHLPAYRDAIIAKFKKKFASVFTSGLGRCTTTKATLMLKPDAVPIFKKKRPVPYANIAALDKEIDRLLAEDVLSPVTYSKWAAPIVVVKKANGTIRLCADYSTGLNDALMLHQHPLPTPDDVFTKLNGGTVFTQIDFADAYLQVEVDDASKELLTINTHRGLFSFNRLPFGVKSAPGIFQQIMDSMIAGLDGCAAYLDDVIVTGRTTEEHIANLEALFQRIHEFGFRVRIEKCSFLMPQIRYLGNIIDADGRHPDPAKTEVIKKMPPPKDIGQLRSFLGLLNYYGAFVEEMRKLRAPLEQLLKKDVPFRWSTDCQQAFDRAKEVLSSDLLLTHYDPSKEIVVAADASEYGIGAVISHRFSDGTEKPIYHACRTLTAAEENYGQVEKEGLALVFAVRKFHRYLHGRHFKLLTDHKPLLAIYGSKKGIPVYTANRLQRWSLIMMNYNFTIEYRTTKNFGQADALSRLIADQPTSLEDAVIAEINVDAVNLFSKTSTRLPVTADIVAEETLKDPQLKEVFQCVKTGKWPKKPKNQLLRFNSMRNNLTTHRGCLLFGDRIVIPDKLQAAVLADLHDGHPGMSRMKMLARDYCYWPHIDKDIEDKVKSCNQCQENAKNPTKTSLCSWPDEEGPWIRIHADYAGPIDGRMFLVIVDAHSKMAGNNGNVNHNIGGNDHGFPPHLLSVWLPADTRNGQWNAICVEGVQRLLPTNGIKHLRSPPFHPQSNGQAERFVDTFKRTLQKLKGEGTTQEALQKFLFNYRRTPCSTLSGQSPAEVFLGRRLRSTLTLLKPSEPTIELRRNQKMEAQFNKHHAARPKMFEPDDLVWTRDYRAGYPRWAKGRIRLRHGQCIYDVEVDGQLWRRQANQLRPRTHSEDCMPLADQLELPLLKCPSAEEPTQDQEIELNENQLPTQIDDEPTADNRQSRTRRPPVRLQIDPRKKTYTTSIDDEPTADNRQSRTRRPPVRLQIDPRKKTYTASVHLGREVLDPYSDEPTG
ncbi:integrase core domain protein [Teladorsagia circumcincta]|uniref:RNA-directed DNA polymerase n=1 Tax=Teladorsagia circumcincta TaxID=45464 RepID=A0A2G9UR66_TELCI|nr:integrase core domain protein [Teladorsagia circumcincta]